MGVMAQLIMAWYLAQKRRKKKRVSIRKYYLLPKKYSGLLYLARKAMRLINSSDDLTFRRIFRLDLHLFGMLEHQFQVCFLTFIIYFYLYLL